MPRLEVMDCKAGHGKLCKSRPLRVLANRFCVCSCHTWAGRGFNRKNDESTS